MKNFILLALSTLLTSCRCEFSGYSCDTRNIASTLELNDIFYDFKDEISTDRSVFERDSIIRVNFSITRRDRPGYASQTTLEAVGVNLVILEKSVGNFSIDTVSSSAFYYNIDSGRTNYTLKNAELEMSLYESCDCCDELNMTNSNMIGKFKCRVKSELVSEDSKTNMDFHVHTETVKIRMEDC